MLLVPQGSHNTCVTSVTSVTRRHRFHTNPRNTYESVTTVTRLHPMRAGTSVARTKRVGFPLLTAPNRAAHNDVVTRLTLESGNIEPIRDHTRREAAKRRSGQCHAFHIHSFPRESLDNQLAEYYVFGNLRLRIEFIIIKEKNRNFTSDCIGEHDKAGPS